MGKTIAVTATHDQWQWVMYYLGGFLMPEKLGDKEYKLTERTRIQDDITALFDDLLPHSHFAKQYGEEYAPLFGDEEDWSKERKQDGSRKALKPTKTYVVELSEKGVHGLMWLFTVLLTPPEEKTDAQGKKSVSHPYYVLPSIAARFVWPLAKAVNRTNNLRRSVGIKDEPLQAWAEDVEVAR